MTLGLFGEMLVVRCSCLKLSSTTYKKYFFVVIIVYFIVHK